MTWLCVRAMALEIYKATMPSCGANTRSGGHNRVLVAFCHGEKGGLALPETDLDWRGNYQGKTANKGALEGPE